MPAESGRPEEGHSAAKVIAGEVPGLRLSLPPADGCYAMTSDTLRLPVWPVRSVATASTVTVSPTWIPAVTA